MSTRLTPTRSPQDPRPGTVDYRGDLTPPVTSYASGRNHTAFGSREKADSSTAWTRSAMVDRKPRRGGLQAFYGYGAERQHLPNPYPGGNDGLVRSSAFQPFLNHLFNFHINTAWFEAGYPRNLGWTFRVNQLKTQPTGGPTRARMDVKPGFTRVQRVPRYSTVPKTYATRSARA